MKHIDTDQLTLEDVPSENAASQEILGFSRTLNGRNEVGGDQLVYNAYLKNLKAQALESLSLNDLRILLSAQQRAHYSSGGGWGGHDPLMDEMRLTVARIRQLVKSV